MKILEISKFYFPKRGAESHFLELIKLLQSGGHEVAVFSMEHEKNIPSEWQKYFVSTVGYTGEYSAAEKLKGVFRMFYSFEAKRKINLLLDEFKPDVVHIHNIYHQLSPAILFEIKKRGIPVVMTVHDFKIVCPNHSIYLNGKPYERCKNGRYYQCILDKCVKGSYFKSVLAAAEMYWHEMLGTYSKNIDKYIAPSRFVKERLVERGIKSEKIEIIPHFIASEESPDLDRRPAENSLPKALYLGAISKDKGIDVIVDIFKTIGSAELYLAGNMEDEYDFSGIENIHYLGFLNKEKLNEILQKSDCVISGSKLPETFGLVALESLAHGKPFFGFDVGAYGEIIQNGRNGFVADSNESLKKALEDFFEGRSFYIGAEIKSNAFRKYSKRSYLEKITRLFAGVSGS